MAEAFELGYEPLGVRFVASAAVLLDACRDVGRPVVIVSNNAEPAIEAFLDHHDLRHLIDGAPANNRR